jgi:hypothetical protein
VAMEFSVAAAALLLVLAAASPAAFADSNLATCLDGRYAALCDKSKLTPDQLRRTMQAEHAANLSS